MTDPQPALDVTAALSMDPSANRAARKYSTGDQLRRILWSLLGWTVRITPRPLFALRNTILRAFGARIGSNVHIYPTTRIYMPWNVEIGDWVAIGEDALIYSLGKVRILSGAAISYRAHVCAGTHDFADPALTLLKLPVVIAENAWIGTEAFIGPGVTIGRGALIGARAVVVKDVAPLQIVAGNPARVIGARQLRSAGNE